MSTLRPVPEVTGNPVRMADALVEVAILLHAKAPGLDVWAIEASQPETGGRIELGVQCRDGDVDALAGALGLTKQREIGDPNLVGYRTSTPRYDLEVWGRA